MPADSRLYRFRLGYDLLSRWWAQGLGSQWGVILPCFKKTSVTFRLSPHFPVPTFPHISLNVSRLERWASTGTLASLTGPRKYLRPYTYIPTPFIGHFLVAVTLGGRGGVGSL